MAMISRVCPEQRECESFLTETMTAEVVARCLLAASAHQSSNLKRAALHFCKHNAQCIIKVNQTNV